MLAFGLVMIFQHNALNSFNSLEIDGVVDGGESGQARDRCFDLWGNEGTALVRPVNLGFPSRTGSVFRPGFSR